MYKYLTLAVILALPIGALAQDTPDPWEPLRFLEGRWNGTGEGMGGTSTVTQTYEFILGGKFMQITTRSEFPPQEKNPNGEIHEDLSILSFDRGRGTHVLRGFYVEGFVNTFTLDSISADGALWFNTIEVENGPPGTKARLVYRKISETEMEEGFWVAFVGKELSCMVTNRLTKSK